MEDSPKNIDAVIAEIKAGNEKRTFDSATAVELGDAAITRLAIESAINSAS